MCMRAGYGIGYADGGGLGDGEEVDGSEMADSFTSSLDSLIEQLGEGKAGVAAAGAMGSSSDVDGASSHDEVDSRASSAHGSGRRSRGGQQASADAARSGLDAWASSTAPTASGTSGAASGATRRAATPLPVFGSLGNLGELDREETVCRACNQSFGALGARFGCTASCAVKCPQLMNALGCAPEESNPICFKCRATCSLLG